MNSDDNVEIVQRDMQVQIYDTFKEEPISAQSTVKEIENKIEQLSYDLLKS